MTEWQNNTSVSVGICDKQSLLVVNVNLGVISPQTKPPLYHELYHFLSIIMLSIMRGRTYLPYSDQSLTTFSHQKFHIRVTLLLCGCDGIAQKPITQPTFIN